MKNLSPRHKGCRQYFTAKLARWDNIRQAIMKISERFNGQKCVTIKAKKTTHFLNLKIRYNSQMREHKHIKSFIIMDWSEGDFLMDFS